jgi:hypothetical protein
MKPPLGILDLLELRGFDRGSRTKFLRHRDARYDIHDLLRRACSIRRLLKLNYFTLPIFASYRWVLIVFFGALVFFHVVLVLAWPLGKIGWKRVDYVWLLFGLLGVLGGVGSVRQRLAEGLLPRAKQLAQAQATWVIGRIDFGASPVVCRKFEPSILVPRDEEFDRRQREFDTLCAWFTTAKSRVANGLPEEQPLTLERLGGSPAPTGADPWMVATLNEAVTGYNQAQDALEHLRREASQSEGEFTLVVLAPFLIAVAIALRMTKVTGELCH